jgi:hypothetical protein
MFSKGDKFPNCIGSKIYISSIRDHGLLILTHTHTLSLSLSLSVPFLFFTLSHTHTHLPSFIHRKRPKNKEKKKHYLKCMKKLLLEEDRKDI